MLLVFVTTLVLSACSPTTNGTATPTGKESAPSPTSPETGAQLPGPGVPNVDIPIDLARFKQAPCSGLTDAQAQELVGPTVESKARPNGDAGPGCGWSPPAAARPLVYVVFGGQTNRGLTAVYEAKGKAYKFVEPLASVDDYPLVAFGAEDERATKGHCLVAVGTSNSEVISIGLEQSEANIGKKDPCDTAREVAIRVLATVRGAN
ncbi:DUF3558 domain-containing protein [Amycolatopsis regifaucium]|nr:DUF3558 domain-containing protein [Amycolatopsis regifaucium]